MPITNIPANKNVGKSLGDINGNFAYLDSENEDRKKDLSDKLDKSAVDSTLSSESENPVQNKAVYAAIQNAGSKITVDNILDITSENPVQNKVITRELTNTNQDISTLSARVKVLENGTDPDISADFLTKDGFGNLRYYNGHFQYYDTGTSSWVDTSITPNNVYILNMMPQPMVKMVGTYDTDISKYKLKFEEPADTIIDGQAACIVDKVIIRRKLGSVPVDENDGDLAVIIKRSEFGLYKNNWYIDNSLTPNLNDVYYYKAFPMSTTGFCNAATVNETLGLKCKDYNLYGFKLDQNESDPASMITYLPDCDNSQYKSAFMNYTTDTFDYGDWGDVWFIKNLKPVMLKYDGTVDYELDKDDYTKKVDGTDSDVANTAYEGNAMIGFPKVYWKIVDNADNTANIYFCDKKIDNDFVCWSHIDNNGNEIDYCYMGVYEGSNYNNILRSISNVMAMGDQTATNEMLYAQANNIDYDIIWNTSLLNDRMLICLLLLLIGKSTNTQTIFGTGNINSYVSITNNGMQKTGVMNNKGLFYGTNNNIFGVKVFGIEQFYGNSLKRIAGLIYDNGVQKIKLTHGQSDGSTTDGYNLNGSGYISINNSAFNISNGYISKMIFSNNCLIPKNLGASETTYYCDAVWSDNSKICYPLFGGTSGSGGTTGALSVNLTFDGSFAAWHNVTSISCKPLAPTT